MEKYYISIDEKQTGPFTLDEIRAMNLSDNNLIWKENMPNWINLSEFHELKTFIKITPPPLPDKKFQESKCINEAFLISAILLFLCYILILFACGGFESDYDLEKRYIMPSMDAPAIREVVFGFTLVLALVPSLIIFIINYRIGIKREISRLKG